MWAQIFLSLFSASMAKIIQCRRFYLYKTSIQNSPPTSSSHKVLDPFILKHLPPQPSRNNTPLHIGTMNVKRLKAHQLPSSWFPFPNPRLLPTSCTILGCKPWIFPVKRDEPSPLMNWSNGVRGSGVCIVYADLVVCFCVWGCWWVCFWRIFRICMLVFWLCFVGVCWWWW